MAFEAGDTSSDPNAPNASADAQAILEGDFVSKQLNIDPQDEPATWAGMEQDTKALQDETYEYDSGHAALADILGSDDPHLYAQNSNTTIAHLAEQNGIDIAANLPDGVTERTALGIHGWMAPNPPPEPDEPSEPQTQRRHRERRERRARAQQEALQDDPAAVPPPHGRGQMGRRRRHEPHAEAAGGLPPGHHGGQMGRHRREGAADDTAAAGAQRLSAAGALSNIRTMEVRPDAHELNARHMLARWLPTVAQPADDPVDRALEAGPGALSDADRGRAMRHDAYWENTDPRRDALHHAIRQGYRHQFGTGPQTHDETGKPETPVEINPLPQNTQAPAAAGGASMRGLLGGLDRLLGTASNVAAWQRALNALDNPTPAEVAQKRPPRGTLAKLDDPTTAPPLVPPLDDLKQDGLFGPKTAAKTRRVLTKRPSRTIQVAVSNAAKDLQNNNAENWNGL